LWYWGLNSRPSPWAIPPALFCDGSFQDRVSWTICLGWLRTMISSNCLPPDHCRLSSQDYRLWAFSTSMQLLGSLKIYATLWEGKKLVILIQ
jgi:hypothetical protein